ncbi:MAG: DUF2169 domain-containing protein, partial [Chitinimonas sp.]|nr:DUF2169 domain-containing protein [Chitinimonas sp.]
PFLPEDFDERFNQCAPMDQQTDYLLGGEEIVLLNLHPSQPDIRFKLPPLDGITPKVLRNDYSSEMPACHADTLYIEPEQNRFSIVWRASTPIRRRLQEFKTIAIGPVNPQWWKEQTLGMEGGCSGCGSSPLVIADITDEDE